MSALRFRFSLSAMLVAVTVSSVACALGHRTIVGSLANHHAAAEIATETVRAHALWRSLEVKRLELVSIEPRSYRVYGIAANGSVISVLVTRQEDGSFTCDGTVMAGD